MSKTLNGAVLHTLSNNPSLVGQVIKAASLPAMTRAQVDEAIDACDLLNAQITDTIDLISDAVVSDETERLHVANALNLIAGVARLNNDILARLAGKLLEGRKWVNLSKLGPMPRRWKRVTLFK